MQKEKLIWKIHKGIVQKSPLAVWISELFLWYHIDYGEYKKYDMCEMLGYEVLQEKKIKTFLLRGILFELKKNVCDLYILSLPSPFLSPLSSSFFT